MIRQSDIDELWDARKNMQENITHLRKRREGIEAQIADSLEASRIYARAAYAMEQELKSNATHSS